MHKKRALIYPYDCESTCLIRFNHLNKIFDIVGIVSPRGWGLTDKDAGIADGGDMIGLRVENGFEVYDDNDYDAIALVDSCRELDFENIIYPKLESLIAKGKDIICLKEVDASQLKLMKDLCDKYDTSFQHFSCDWEPIKPNMTNIFNIEVPIVFVLGLGDRTQKFNIQLSIWEGLKNLGYNVSQIGSKNYSNIFGFHPFPSFMFSKNLKEQDKVILFNRMVKKIEIEEKPDVIVIGIPGGIMAINKDITQGFGILPYLICQAVKADISILSVYYDEYNAKFFREIEILAKYRFGTLIDCFNISNIKIDYLETENSKEMSYIMLDTDFIDRKKNNYVGVTKAIFNVLNKNDQNNMTRYIINTLSVNETIKLVL